MKQRTVYTEKQLAVRYQEIDSNRADVIVNEFISEEKINCEINDSTTQTMYVYWTNIFSVNPSVITENDIASNLAYYLNYEEEKEKTLEEKVVTLESENQMLTQCILELSAQVYK